MGKHAYLIMAHQDIALLNELLSCLDDERNGIYLHLDKRMKFREEELYVPNHTRIQRIKRCNVTWGGWSQIAVEMALLNAAVSDTEYDYLHLLSGQDLPLKTQDEIHEWFSSQSGKNFISLDQNPENQARAGERIATYHILQDWIGRKNRGIFGIFHKLEGWCCKLQHFFLIDRTRKLPFKIYKGANWFSITGAMAKEILHYEAQIKQWFGHGLCADELFLQTIAYNSRLKDTIVEDDLRLIDWQRGEPYIFTYEDKELLSGSTAMFARKFSSAVDQTIIQEIGRQVKARE